MNVKPWFPLLACVVILIASCSDNSKGPSQEETPAAPVAAEPQAQAPAPQAEVPQCLLNMGWDPWEPYQYLTPEDEVKGLEIELVSAIAKNAGCSLNFVQKNWMNLLSGIREGEVDLLGGASKTIAREAFALFSDTYRQETFVLYVRAGDSGRFDSTNLEQMLAKNFRLGVTEDYIYGETVTALQDDPAYADSFVSVPTTEVNYFNLVQDNIDGFLEDPFVAAYTIKRKGLTDQIVEHPLQIHSGDVALMFSKKSVTPEVVDRFNQALATIKANGEYQRILDKYRY